ncbi:MAG: hypothetical protein PHD76_12925 [Methylacidiphilales bacterium]|nr:hypothetical protein [Candidatus Methylacidiphilales bacterium]
MTKASGRFQFACLSCLIWYASTINTGIRIINAAISAFGLSLLLGLPLHAQILVSSVTGSTSLLGNHGSNLITNGSFETGASTTTDSFSGGIIRDNWTQSSGLTGFNQHVPTGWSNAGSSGANNYATWTNTAGGALGSVGQSYYPGTGANAGSDPISSAAVPDGSKALYFGNLYIASVSAGIHINSDVNGVLSMTAGTGTLSHTLTSADFHPSTANGTSRISQAVTLIAGHKYLLDFWAGGEDSNIVAGTTTDPQYNSDGIFMASITSTSTTSQFFFDSASGTGVDAQGLSSGVGTFQRYHINFIAASTGTYTLSFQSWGHGSSSNTVNWFTGTQASGVGASELVLDDVILNDLTPEASTLAAGAVVLMMAGFPLCRFLFSIVPASGQLSPSFPEKGCRDPYF